MLMHLNELMVSDRLGDAVQGQFAVDRDQLVAVELTEVPL